LDKHRLGTDSIPKSVLSHLERGGAGEIPETLKVGDLDNAQVTNHVIATAYKSLEAAAEYVRTQGYEAVILGDTITGEAQDVGVEQAALARQYVMTKIGAPIALISGGECTVTIPNGVKGQGGRCSEYLLSLLAASTDLPKITALAADTDGIDGSEKNAGAWFTPAIRQAAHEQNLIPSKYLSEHDCYGFFAQLDALVETGPTLTNVNDFRIILLDK
jgi:hydroxypyruvate reductase